MEIPDGHFHHILRYYFRKGKNAVQARKKLYDVYGEKSLTERQCQNWFALFFPEILTSKVHHALDAQLKMTTK